MTADTDTPQPDASPVQLYVPGVPFAPTDAGPLTDDEVRERAIGEGVFGWVMFDKMTGAQHANTTRDH